MNDWDFFDRLAVKRIIKDLERRSLMIRCANLTKSFSDKKVLSGIDIDIKRGQIFGLLGPSGAGKTTLIMILTG